MSNQDESRNRAVGPRFDTPGSDTIMHSNNPDVPSPSETSRERLSSPGPGINPTGETPGDANPALNETIGFEQGQMDTAGLLRARETAEEQGVRVRGGAHPYQDQDPGEAPDEYARSDTGRSAWPDNREENPIEYMESPRADSPLMSGSPDKLDGDLTMKGRIDATVERGSTEAAEREALSGLPPTGFSAGEDIDERREMNTSSEPSDFDHIPPGMLNIPSEDDNEHR